jgi:tetratricopeptide (TPR) repeat protein
VGDFGQARKVLEEGLAFAETHLAGRRENVVTGFLSNALASVADAQKDYRTALARASQAAQFFEDAAAHLSPRAPEHRQVQMRRRAAQSLVVVAKAHLALGHRDEADAAFDKAVKYARLIGARDVEVEVLEGRGSLALSPQDWSRARSLYQQGIALASQINRPMPLIWLNEGLSRALGGLGRPDEALAAARESVRRVEEVREELGDSGLRSGFLEDKQRIYQQPVRLALEAQHPDEAFGLAERSRARAFLDLLGSQTSYDLIRAFYERLERLGPVRALRQAQVETMQTFPHPFSWAAFGLTGVPR